MGKHMRQTKGDESAAAGYICERPVMDTLAGYAIGKIYTNGVFCVDNFLVLTQRRLFYSYVHQRRPKVKIKQEEEEYSSSPRDSLQMCV